MESVLGYSVASCCVVASNDWWHHFLQMIHYIVVYGNAVVVTYCLGSVL
jgi:hypothetical protein